ncbi:MAG: hypothetical protein WC492_00930 [Candidatus Micrarchaeia archaeon]
MITSEVAALYGIGIGAAIVAFTYMVGRFTGSQTMAAYSKIEVGELFFAAILLAIVLGALASNAYIIKVLTGGSFESPQDAVVRMQAIMETPLVSTIDVMTRNTFRFTKVASYSYNYQGPNIYVAAPTSSASPGAGGNPIISQMLMAIDTSSMTLMLAKAMRIAFVFFQFAFFAALMPIGILLRAIGPTRKIGALLIGTGLALQFVFPVAVAWSTELGASFAPSLLTWQKDALPAKGGAGLSLPDMGNPAGSEFIANDVVSVMYGFGNILGPGGVCTLACALVCLPTLPYGGFPACYTSCYGTPNDPAPTNPGTACDGILGMVMYILQIGFPIATSIALETSPLNMSATEIVNNFYNPLVDTIMPIIVERNLAILIMIVLQLSATIVLARAFSNALGSEGQLYGIGRLV